MSVYLDTKKILKEWVDYNNHLNMAYYILIFDHATDAFHATLGITEEYRRTTRCSTFAVESHTNYIAEVYQGDEVCVTTQMLGYDEKRIHYFHRMYDAKEKFLSATTEIMTVHVDLDIRKVVPIKNNIRENIKKIFSVHSVFPKPNMAGRVINIPKL